MPIRSLIRREPRVQDLLDFRRDFDDLFSQMFHPASIFGSGPAMDGWIPPVETFVDQNRFHVRMAVPGVKPGEVNVQVHGNQLTISGERKQETKNPDQYLQREFSYGAFERTVMLPEGVQTDRIEASCDNGVLEIAAPISEKSMPRRIEIKEGDKLPASSQSSERKVA